MGTTEHTEHTEARNVGTTEHTETTEASECGNHGTHRNHGSMEPRNTPKPRKQEITVEGFISVCSVCSVVKKAG